MCATQVSAVASRSMKKPKRKLKKNGLKPWLKSKKFINAELNELITWAKRQFGKHLSAKAAAKAGILVLRQPTQITSSCTPDRSHTLPRWLSFSKSTKIFSIYKQKSFWLAPSMRTGCTRWIPKWPQWTGNSDSRKKRENSKELMTRKLPLPVKKPRNKKQLLLLLPQKVEEDDEYQTYWFCLLIL